MKRFLLVLLAAGVILGVVAFVVSREALVLALDEDVPVWLRGKLPLKATIAQSVDVELQGAVTATVKLERMEIPIDETIEVPLDFRMKVPIDAPMRVDQTIDVALTVPIDVVLTERELDLSKLEVPIDTELFIDDTIPIELMIPIDTEIETALGVKVPVKSTVPIKTSVPIHQTVRVRDKIVLGVSQLRVPLHLQVPVKAEVPIHENIRVHGEVEVLVKRTVGVPIRQVIRPDLGDEVHAQVTLHGNVPAKLAADLATEVTMDEAIPTRIGEIRLDVGNVRVERRDTRKADGAVAPR